MPHDLIVVRGAREHNLKNIDVEIPREKLVVITGASRNPRSTVATQTEIYDYLRLLYARTGRPHCPQCGKPIQRQTVQQIVDAILELPAGRRLMILAPIVRDRKGEYHKVFEDARKAGFVRVFEDLVILSLA